jgi:hypothetical protein
MKRTILLTTVVCVLCVAATTQADAVNRIGFQGWGPRLGLTINPDQFHFGGHLDLGYFAEHIRFQPNLEIGFGDNVRLVAVNFEADYRFASRWDVWTPYLGGGLGINIYDWNSNHHAHGSSSTDLGVNMVGGIERGLSNGDRFFIEAKLGLADSPDFKATIGWTFFH